MTVFAEEKETESTETRKRRVAFTISFKDLDSPAKFTIDPRLPVIDSSRQWTFGADFERESHPPREKRKEWGEVTLKHFKFVEPGAGELRSVSLEERSRDGAIRMFEVSPLYEGQASRTRTASRFVAFTAVFAAADGKSFEIDPIYVDDPGDSNTGY